VAASPVASYAQLQPSGSLRPGSWRSEASVGCRTAAKKNLCRALQQRFATNHAVIVPKASSTRVVTSIPTKAEMGISDNELLSGLDAWSWAPAACPLL
jgi:hypothetical protein